VGGIGIWVPIPVRVRE